MSQQTEKNIFHDINKLPSEKGLLLFGLSMNKLSNRQSAQQCIKDIRHFVPSKITRPSIGVNFIYSDFLYFYNDKTGSELKHSFMNQTIDHKNSLEKIIEKNSQEFQIQHAFNYMGWNQLYLGTKDFNHLFEKIKKLYAGDTLFQRYLAEDCKVFDREVTENQIHYFLEEALMIYLLNKNQVKLSNEYIENNQRWVLFCYPGRPIKSIIYLAQLNPFHLEWEENPYQNAFYDLEAKQLIEFNNVDLETYEVR